MTSNADTTHLDMVRGRTGLVEPITGVALAAIVSRFPDVHVPVRITAVSWSAGRFDYTYTPVGGEGVGTVSAKKIVKWDRHPDA